MEINSQATVTKISASKEITIVLPQKGCHRIYWIMAITNHCPTKLRKANSSNLNQIDQEEMKVVITPLYDKGLIIQTLVLLNWFIEGITTLYPLIRATVLNSKLLTVRQQYELPRLLKLQPKFCGFLNATTEMVDFWGAAAFKEWEAGNGKCTASVINTRCRQPLLSLAIFVNNPQNEFRENEFPLL
ncbi:hypothetical protein WUBG_01086 [Wuchereria bancrofti]|uniref:Uncharacterized protein n=1 Tax=Wuchereria bancrofti TaxID=6293 RepID=J9FEG7_WUCBA|nr:hypothetical protein WUBG_01086 [Wuchereria bancrofti]